MRRKARAKASDARLGSVHIAAVKEGLLDGLKVSRDVMHPAPRQPFRTRRKAVHTGRRRHPALCTTCQEALRMAAPSANLGPSLGHHAYLVSPSTEGPIASCYRVDPPLAFPPTPFAGFAGVCRTPRNAALSQERNARGSIGGLRGQGALRANMYSLVALVARFAVASVFWRSGPDQGRRPFPDQGQYVLSVPRGVQGSALAADVAAYMWIITEHVFPVLLRRGSCLAAFRSRPHVHDARH